DRIYRGCFIISRSNRSFVVPIHAEAKSCIFSTLPMAFLSAIPATKKRALVEFTASRDCKQLQIEWKKCIPAMTQQIAIGQDNETLLDLEREGGSQQSARQRRHRDCRAGRTHAYIIKVRQTADVLPELTAQGRGVEVLNVDGLRLVCKVDDIVVVRGPRPSRWACCRGFQVRVVPAESELPALRPPERLSGTVNGVDYSSEIGSLKSKSKWQESQGSLSTPKSESRKIRSHCDSLVVRRFKFKFKVVQPRRTRSPVIHCARLKCATRTQTPRMQLPLKLQTSRISCERSEHTP
ncbi:hypothetical protein C8Q74DRAFT_1395117, partial [Fomes fomentarius]